MNRLTIELPGYKKKKRFLIARIRYLEGWRNYTYYYIEGMEQPLLRSRTMKYCLAELPGFVRVSRSHAVNPAHVEVIQVINTLHRGKVGMLTLNGRSHVPVSRRKLNEVRQQLAA